MANKRVKLKHLFHARDILRIVRYCLARERLIFFKGHFDFQENFTIQLKGAKKWTLKDSGIQDPVRGSTPHYKAFQNMEQQVKLHTMKFSNFNSLPEDINENTQEVTLTAGNVLYFPAGKLFTFYTLLQLL